MPPTKSYISQLAQELSFASFAVSPASLSMINRSLLGAVRTIDEHFSGRRARCPLKAAPLQAW